MKFALTLLVALLLLVAGFVGGYYTGLRSRTSKHAVEEFKVCHINLTQGFTNLSPQTREYLKERLYWNAAIYIPEGFFPEYRFDFGPVNDSALAGARGIKDCSTSNEIYEYAMKKHGQKGKHPHTTSSNQTRDGN